MQAVIFIFTKNADVMLNLWNCAVDEIDSILPRYEAGPECPVCKIAKSCLVNKTFAGNDSTTDALNCVNDFFDTGYGWNWIAHFVYLTILYCFLDFTFDIVKTSLFKIVYKWWVAGEVTCLEWSANDMHIVQLMPLPPVISCFTKVQNGGKDC